MGLCRLCLTDSDDCIAIFGAEGRKHHLSAILSEYFWFQIIENDPISTLVCQKCWYNTSTFQVFHNSIKLAQQSLFKHSTYVSYGSADSETGAQAPGDCKPIEHSARDGTTVALEEQLIDASIVHQQIDAVALHCPDAVDNGLLDGVVIESAGAGGSSAVANTSTTGNMYSSITITMSDEDIKRNVASCKLEPPESMDGTQQLQTDAETTAIDGDDQEVAVGSLVYGEAGKPDAQRRARSKTARKPKTDEDDSLVADDGNYSDAVAAEEYDEYEVEEEDEEDDEDDDDDEEDDEDEEHDDGSDDSDDADDDDEDLPILPKHSPGSAARRSSASSPKKRKKKRRRSSKRTRAEEDARIRSVCNVYCSLCLMSFETFCDLSKHYRLAHDRKGYVMCCDRKMTTRSRLLEHVETHLNPDAFQCGVCEVRFSGRFPLKKHMDTHMSEAEKPYACADCPQRYAKLVLLARHRFNVHSADEEKKFRCDVCDKRYLSAAKLAEHVKRSHDFVPEICDVCGKEFKSIYNLNVHRTEVHMGHEVPRMQCNICGTWLREKYLKKHLKRHNAEVETCTVCGKTLQNKNSLGNHMRNVHGNRMHQCAVCGKTFSKPLSLREHMALHTGQDLYTCPYCPKTFKSGANMHSHRKKYHFEDWSKDRGKRLVTSNYL